MTSWLTPLLDHLTYPVITFLMLLESTIVPVPSELVIAPAAYHSLSSSQSLPLIILCATIGADAGASINYIVSRLLGRPLIYRFAASRLGCLCLLSPEKLNRAESYFLSHGAFATISGRLIIGIRHLISIPAGLAKMSYPRFLLYTTIGAAAWHTILAILGVVLHSIVPEEQLSATISAYSSIITLILVILVIAAIIILLLHTYKKPPSK